MSLRAIVACLSLTSAALAQSGGWQRSFGEGVGPVGTMVKTYAGFDPDGPGSLPPRLVIAGDFETAAGTPVNRIAAWDGTRWSLMDSGLSCSDPNFNIQSLHFTYSSQVLYAGGGCGPDAYFARWTGTSWVSLPAPNWTNNNPTLDYLHALDPDGVGPLPERLVAGMSIYGGLYRVTRLFEWDGLAWQQLPGQWGGVTSDMTVYQPPGGQPALYIAIWSFGVSNSYQYSLVRWDGVQTTTIATESCSQSCGVQLNAIEVVNDLPGGQGSLYAAGRFTTFAGIPARSVARWDGQTWQAADAGLGTSPAVSDLTVFDIDGDGPGGPRLVASAAAIDMPRSLVSWNGSTWSTPHVAFDGGLHRIIPFNDGVPSLFAMGRFSVTGNNFTSRISRSIGTLWAPVGQSLNNSVHTLAAVPPGSGVLSQGLYAGGAFYTAGNSLAIGVVHWDGIRWAPIMEGADNRVNAMVFGQLSPSSVHKLYIGGAFTARPAFHIAQWDGHAWRNLGPGLYGDVHAMAFANESLYVGGSFTGPASRNIARWNGQSWNFVGPEGTDGAVFALAANKGDVVAGGSFNTAGGLPASNIARWNGAWSSLGDGFNGPVRAIAFYDDGLGAALFAAGDFTQSGGTPVSRIARWNGMTWTALGSGLNAPAHALTVSDPDGPGPLPARLIVGGEFTQAGTIATNRIAQWDGSAWHTLDTGTDNTVRALAVHDADANGPQPHSLFLGGDFRSAAGASSPFIAHWLPTPCYPNCDNSTTTPTLTANDFLCFLTNFAAGNPYANCDASTSQPLLTANDFSCFLNSYVAGCP